MDVSFLGEQQTIGMKKEGGFPRSVGTHQGHFLAMMQEERYPSQGLITIGICMVYLVESEIMMAHSLKLIGMKRNVRNTALHISR